MIHRGAAATIGVAVAIFGLALGTFAAFELARGGDGTTELESYVGLIVLFIAMTIWGARMAWTPLGLPRVSASDLNWRPRRQSVISKPRPLGEPTDQDREGQILRLAEKERGRVTVLEVAARCDLTAERAKALLDGLAARKVAELHVSAAGVLVYVFPRFLPRSGRKRRRR